MASAVPVARPHRRPNSSTNTAALSPIAQPPAAAGAEEFYLADLVGLEAFDARRASRWGGWTAVHDYGAGASLEIGPLLVPFTRAAVPAIDLAAGRHDRGAAGGALTHRHRRRVTSDEPGAPAC